MSSSLSTIASIVIIAIGIANLINHGNKLPDPPKKKRRKKRRIKKKINVNKDQGE